MKFWQAMKILDKGGKVKRKGYDVFVAKHKIMTSDRVVVGVYEILGEGSWQLLGWWEPCNEDLGAEWEVYEDTPLTMTTPT